MNEDQPTQSTSPTEPRPSSPTRWALLFPIALLAIIVFLNSRARDSQSTLAPVAATSTPATRQTAAPIPTTAKAALKPLKLTIFVPDNDGKLQRQIIERPTRMANEAVAANALALLFQKATDIIPPGTRLTAPIRKEKEGPGGAYWEVSLNSKFFDSKIWRSEKVTELAVNAIVQTASDGIHQDIKPTYPIRIKILNDGKPVSTLGEYDISEPLDAGGMASGAAENHE